MVTNEQGVKSGPDEGRITINPIPAVLKPIVGANPDQFVNSNSLVQLDGSNSSDSNGFPLKNSWNQTSGPQVILSDSHDSLRLIHAFRQMIIRKTAF